MNNLVDKFVEKCLPRKKELIPVIQRSTDTSLKTYGSYELGYNKAIDERKRLLTKNLTALVERLANVDSIEKALHEVLTSDNGWHFEAPHYLYKEIPERVVARALSDRVREIIKEVVG